MLEAKYYRDYKHNYMILQCGREEIAGSYQYKILTSGKIEEILKCAVRHMNGITYYYYDISSRTTLESLYRDKKMSYDQVKDVLWQLHGICDRLSGYFMEEAGLVLLPEHIYYDLTNRKYIGLYYPGYQSVGAEAYRPLMEFLLDHIDTEDRKLTEDIYRICELAEESYFTIEDALQILEEPAKEEQPCVPVYESARLEAEPHQKDEEPSRPLSAEELYAQMSGERFSAGKLPCEDMSCGEQAAADRFSGYAPYEKRPAGKPPKRNLFYPVFMVFAVLGMAGALWVRGAYELTGQEETVLYGCVAALGLCVVICIAGLVRGKNGNAEKADGKEGTRGERADRKNGKFGAEYFPEAEAAPVSLANVISRDMDLDMADLGRLPQVSDERRREPSGSTYSGSIRQNEDYGNTVFFDSSKIGECKLYAVDRKNKKHIELTRFPYTVGKMAGCVDYVLADNSISRIHARFDRQGDRILLTDMNSTNGTYKNGLRMQPQETVEIEPGDEVRFGNLNYCYR